ncbi:MAG: hypothetical protein ILA06_09255 [Bacteroidaceae bacterium]|nr:hypothetical protein [Bacteroidaceae bacterium]
MQTVAAVREGDTALKQRLVQMNYSCLPNEDGSLKGSVRAADTVGMDIDHVKPEEMAAMKEGILSKREALGLLMLEKSARGAGYHLVFRRREGLSQEENLQWASELLGVEFDRGAKDITRVFFTTTASAEDLLYLDDTVFEIKEMKNEEMKNEQSDQQGMDQQGVDQTAYPTSYHDIPFTTIIKRYWQVNNGGYEPTKGDRDTLTYQLATDLRHICGRSFEWLDQVIPCYDGFSLEEKRQKIRNALSSKYEGFPQRLKAVLESLHATRKAGPTDSAQPLERSEALPSLTGGVGGGSAILPPMPTRLPALIKLLISRTPEVYRAAVAHAVFPALGAHLWRVRFPYIDNVEHEATLMNVLMAGTGAGKDCISMPINRIMADIRARDEENLQREREWKREVTSKGANKDKRQRPEGLVIQEIDADMTNPAFVMRMAEADGHFLYTKMNEIEQFDALRGSARGSQQFQIMCLAFDPGNRYGQTRVGVQSVTEKVTVRFNWNATTTILKGQRYFSRVLTDGPISRINFCTIPEREIGAAMPVYGTYDAAFDELLRPYIERLVKATGRIECPQALRLARKLVAETAEQAVVMDDRVYENLSFRANVIAYLKAMVLYVAAGCKWSKDIEDFVRWSLQYDLAVKMQFFGEAIREAEQALMDRRQRKCRNLLELLPAEFTVDDAARVRREQGLRGEDTYATLRQWQHRGYIEYIGRDNRDKRDSYRKLKYV